MEEHEGKNGETVEVKRLGDLLYDPRVNKRKFKQLMDDFKHDGTREFVVDGKKVYTGEDNAEAMQMLGYPLFNPPMTRRGFLKMAAVAGGALAMGGVAGCLGSKETVTPTEKAIKKGKAGVGTISTLDCEGYGYLIKELNLLTNKGYDVKYVFVPTSPSLIEGYVAGEIDMLYPGAGNPAIAIEKGLPLKNFGTAMHAHGGWAVTNELYKQGITDMVKFFDYAKERRDQGNPVKVATQVPGTTTWESCGVTILKYGLDPKNKKDIDIKHLPPAEVAAALMSGQVEAQSICEQYDTYPEYFQRGRVIGHGLSEYPNVMYLHPDAKEENTFAICTSAAYNPDMSTEKKKDYLAVQYEAAQYMKDNPQDAYLLFSKISKTPLAVEYVGLQRRARWQAGIWRYSMEQHYKGNQLLGLAKGTLNFDDWNDMEIATELEPPFPSLAGSVNDPGPVDVVSEEFRKEAWKEAFGDVPLFLQEG
jgi:ABC-type nitrate/sulfonate/bicarbonate transport system substrate-binding protein